MSWTLYAGTISSGILTGLVYGLAAMGLSVIFGVVRLVNFAHGEMMVLGMFAAVLLATAWGIDPLLSALPVAGLLFLAGYGLQRGLLNRFIDRPDHQQFILLLGVAMILVNGLLMVFGPDARSTNVPYGFDAFFLGEISLDKTRVYAATGALIVAAALYAFFRFSRTGIAIRACADNQLGAAVVGLNVKGLYATTFGIGSAVVGIAGCLMSLVIDVRPQLAAEYTLLSFIIVIVGGLGSMGGALLGGVLIGVSEALAGVLIDPSRKQMVSYGLLILVLLVRPQGLLGKRA